MNKLKVAIALLLFFLLVIKTFGQNSSGSFEVVKTGQGAQSLLFIPGFACSGDVWAQTKERFERDYTCYTLTMAGFAGVKPQDKPSFDQWTRDIAAYIKTNQIIRPVIIGHSMGGGLAMAIAADYPDLVDKIIVVDALPCLSALMNPTFKAETNPDCATMVNRIISMKDDQFYQMQKISMARLMEDTSMHELAVSWSVRSDRKTFAEMYCNFSNTDLRSRITSIKCPAFVLLEAGFVNNKAVIDEQFINLKTVKLAYANKGLHFIMYDDKEWYLNQISSFLNGK